MRSLSFHGILFLATFSGPAAAEPLPRAIEFKKHPSQNTWERHTVETTDNHADLFDETKTPAFQPSLYGGDSTRQEKATGFFRVQKTAGRWWFIDPLGHPFLSTGIDSLRPFSVEAGRPRMIEAFGTLDSWVEKETARLKSWGFNTAGAWSWEKPLRDSATRIAQTPIGWHGNGRGPLHSYASENKTSTFVPARNPHFSGGIWPIFTDDFARFLERDIARLDEAKDDPWILGWFLDNELSLPRLPSYLDYRGNDPRLVAARNAATEWLAQRKQNRPDQSTTKEDHDEWAGHVFDRYLSLVVPLLRRHAPNHLVLGPRLHPSCLDTKPILQAVGRWCDVLCVNPYGRLFASPTYINEWSATAGKPVLISEFYAKAMDAGLPNTTGYGPTLKTQLDRGLYYQNQLITSLRSPAIIGWHWHRYMDNEPDGAEASPSNRDANKGLVSTTFQPYTAATDLMTRVNGKLHDIAKRFHPENR